MSRHILPFCLALVLAFAAIGAPSPADEQLWSLIKGGGVVVLMRHTVTTPGVGDPSGMEVDKCNTQRNLTDEGRRHAKLIGEAWRAHGVQPDRVMSSPMCRCLETARLAFGRVDESSSVTNGRLEPDSSRQVREIRAIAGGKRRGVVVLVSHGTTIAAATGATLAPGEMIIVKPQGEGQFEVKGKLLVPGP